MGMSSFCTPSSCLLASFVCVNAREQTKELVIEIFIIAFSLCLSHSLYHSLSLSLSLFPSFFVCWALVAVTHIVLWCPRHRMGRQRVLFRFEYAHGSKKVVEIIAVAVYRGCTQSCFRWKKSYQKTQCEECIMRTWQGIVDEESKYNM